MNNLSVEKPLYDLNPPEREVSKLDKLRSYIRFARQVIDSRGMSLVSSILFSDDPQPGDYVETTEREFRAHTFGHLDVIERFKGKDSNEGRKLGILILGGGQAGVVGAGFGTGMYEMGVYQKAKVLMGVSAGIADHMYISIGEGVKGAKIYYEDNLEPDDKKPTESKFIKLPREHALMVKKLWEAYKNGLDVPLMDTMFVGKCFRERRPFDVGKFISIPQEVYTVLLDAETGETKTINVKDLEDPIKGMESAICLPGISSVPWVEDNGRKWVDGAYGDPIPLERMYELGCTDVLVIANVDIEGEYGFLSNLEPFVMNSVARHNRYGYGDKAVAQIADQVKKMKNGVSFIKQTIREGDANRRVAVISPQRAGLVLGNMEENPDRLKYSYNQARMYTRNLFLSRGER